MSEAPTMFCAICNSGDISVNVVEAVYVTENGVTRWLEASCGCRACGTVSTGASMREA